MCCERYKFLVEYFTLHFPRFRIISLIFLNFIIRSAYPVFKQCLKRSTSNCPSTVKKLFEGMFNTFEFVCNDGREGKEIIHAKIHTREIFLPIPPKNHWKISDIQECHEKNYNFPVALQVIALQVATISKKQLTEVGH